MNPDRPLLLAAALHHYGRITIQLTEMPDGYDAVFDTETATLHINPDTDYSAAARAVVGQLGELFDGPVERAFTVVDGALAVAAKPREDRGPLGLRVVR